MKRKIYNELTKEEEDYFLIKELRKAGNGTYSLYTSGSSKLVIKELENKVDSDGQLEIDKELYSYERLKALEIYIPKLIGYNKEENLTIKEYLEGEDLLGIIAENRVTKDTLFELFSYGELLNSDNLNIDYFPNNFVLKGDKLFYINYKVFPYSEELNLRNWGIYYWINEDGIKKYMETGDEKYINVGGKKNPLITAELDRKRDEMYKEYITWKHRKD